MTLPARPHRRTGARAALAVTLTAALALAGCANTDEEEGDAGPEADAGTQAEAGTDASSGAPGAATDSLLPAAEGTTEYPLTLSTWAGETVLEERPERVAVIGVSPNIDALEALDVIPVYSIADDAEWEWRDPQWYASIENVDTATRRDPINYEGIAAADPDLIVAFGFVPDENEFDKLSDIAPVLDTPEPSGTQGNPDWRDNQRLVGEALDLEAATEEVIADAEEQIEAALPTDDRFAGKTITLAYDYGAESGIDYYTTTGGTSEQLMLDIGFEPNPLAENFVDDATVSEENQAMLDADVLLMVYTNDADRETREENALFQEIPAVQEGNYTSLTFNEDDMLVTADGDVLPNAVWVLRGGRSALALPWAVDVIVNDWLPDVAAP